MLYVPCTTKPRYGDAGIIPGHKLSRTICGYLFNVSGSKIYDITKNGNYGIISGATWQHGSLYFGSASNYVDCGNKTLRINDQLTIALRVKFDSAGRLVYKGGTSTCFQIRYYLGNLQFYIATENNGLVGGETTRYDLSTGVWYDIVCVYDGSQMRVYIDGVEDTGRDFPVSASGNVQYLDQPMYIGDRPVEAGSVVGSYDYLYIYNISLIPADPPQLAANPYCWLYSKSEQLIRSVWAISSEGTTTIPVFIHHYRQQGIM